MTEIETYKGMRICCYGCCGNELYCFVRSSGIIGARNFVCIEDVKLAIDAETNEVNNG